MMDASSNQYWQNTQNVQSFELRSHRFRGEMLPVFYQWLGITPESMVLDGGCGSGVFTRYLAGGLTTGHITGFDINEVFIEFGKAKAKELNLSDKMTLEYEDGFNLSYADDTFNAVTNYTYIGVLSDKMAGLKELIRVCKPGGVVSCVIAANSIPHIVWQGSYPFDGADELQRLATLENRIFSDIQNISFSSQLNELTLFDACCLSDIHVYPFSHLICYNDTSFPLEYRKKLALDETREEINWLKGRYSGNEKIYAKHGFDQNAYNRFINLLETKYDYLIQHFDTDKSYEWHGGFNFIVTGIKESLAH